MSELVREEGEVGLVRRASELESQGQVRLAIDLLRTANRAQRSSEIERELVRLRRSGARIGGPQVERPALPQGAPTRGQLVEVHASDLDAEVLLRAWASSGCLLVRELVPIDRVSRLVVGIDEALAASDAAGAGSRPVDPGWFDPQPIPDRIPDGLPEWARRKFLRDRGGLWAADSPRMLFELLELVDELGLGSLMTEVLGERPLLSASKCTLRRVPPDLEVIGGWHQDGAFLGEDVAAFNVWLALSRCGIDAPGLDLVPRRVDRVLSSDASSRFDWSLSDAAVFDAASGVPIVRPEFGPGDALLFDQLLVHRTAVSPDMTRARYAVESWFFAPTAYPDGQLPLLF